MKVYFVSGLGADSRVFKNIRLPHGYETVHLDWISPLKNESLGGYAMRLAQKIDHAEPFALLGLSMGGMIVSEIARIYPPQVGILVSSIAVSGHLPPYFRFAQMLNLHKWVPVGLLKSASIIKRYFKAGKKEDKIILRRLIKDTDPVFLRWAMGAILHWKNDIIPERFYHIHGVNDEILPVRYTKPTHIIAKGDHLMIMNKGEELNIILEEILTPKRLGG